MCASVEYLPHIGGIFSCLTYVSCYIFAISTSVTLTLQTLNFIYITNNHNSIVKLNKA